MNNPYAWLILSLLAIIGFILTIILAIKGKKNRKVAFRKSPYGIIRNIDNELQGLDISYNSKIIDSLTITKFIIWNDGNIKLEETDFASAVPFAIEAEDDCKILNTSILYVSETANAFSIDFDSKKNKIWINFEYFDPKDGIVIQVVHTGRFAGLNVIGKIKSGNKIKNDEEYKETKFDRFTIKFFRNKLAFKIVLFTSSISFFYVSINLALKSWGIVQVKLDPIDPTSIESKFFSVCIGVFAILLLIFLGLISNLDRIPKKLKLHY